MSISGHITEFSCDLKLATQLCEMLARLQSVGFSCKNCSDYQIDLIRVARGIKGMILGTFGPW